MRRVPALTILAAVGGAAVLLGLSTWASARSADALPPVPPGLQAISIRAQAGEIVASAGLGRTAADLERLGAFRLEGFTAICSYRGAGLEAARAAAVTHGCNAVTVADLAAIRLPEGVRAHVVVPGLDWPAWMVANGLKPGEFASLVQTDTVQAARQAGGTAAPIGGGLLTIAPPWPFVDPARLATLPWFIGAHSAEERATSEGSYYGGGVRALGGEVAAARARGWGGVAMSWRQAPAAADGLPQDWAWERIAGPLTDQAVWAVDLLPPAVTGSRLQLAAATLAQALARSGGDRRVRAILPLAGLTAEDARALVALSAFAGAEGLELRIDEADAPAEPVLAAVHDGLALIKAVESLLVGGQASVDGGFAAAIAARHPLVSRISRDGTHAVMTYDPHWAEAGGERSVVLSILPGTSVRFPAGRQVRIFLLHEDARSAASVPVEPDQAAGGDDPQAVAALARLSRAVPRFTVLDLPTSGTVDVPIGATLTIEDLRGVTLDDDPPILGQSPVYTPGVGDGLGPAERVFPARGIAPFRFRYFTNEFNITGRGTAELQDYASAHGFSLMAFRSPEEAPHLPQGARALKWLSRAAPKDIDQHGRYDLLAERADHEDLAAVYASDPFSASSYTPRQPGYELLMIDIEHPVLKPEALRTQAWYPQGGDPAARAAFEARYYRGYAQMYMSAITAARRAGYPQVSIYGWYTVPRTWWGLERLHPDPTTDWAWNAYGKDIYPLVDVIHPSVYCFYVAAQNVAYTLANLDLTRGFLDALPQRKPMRPYYWLKYHGGGATGIVWWANQPIVDEEVRAMHAMAFFTGIDGIDQWDWFSDPRFAGVPDPALDNHLMVGSPFTCAPEGGGTAQAFARYDVLHVLDGDQATGETRFQLIVKDRGPGYGVGEGMPVYRMPRDRLRPHLRPWLENAAAMFEGLALVHPFEYLLSRGTVQVDVSAQEQFAKTLPIVRRVKLGRYHVLITYDPNVLYARLKAGEQTGLDAGTDHRLKVNTAMAGKGIVLQDFAGHRGLTLRLPADDQVRIVVLRGER